MNINFSIDEATGQLLTRLAEEWGETRTALVRRALIEWLERHQETPRWPEAIMEFKGTADMPLFEASRDKLIHPAADPLS
ncbi:MAG TPA: ribbon-helix-helix domain-containing protein [Rhodocyclaceae bacterium]|nr:ribbon-helix-helix domain-containing protein [Rhodocyclaceae bacterium]